jgi:hypothetical protein
MIPANSRQAALEDPIAIEPFTIAVDEAVLSDLCDRIRRTLWPDRVAAPGWDAGTDPEYLRSLLATWAEEFDWCKQERELNRLSHYRARIGGRWVHFVHERGVGPAPLPIVLTHGFPSSFVEHLDLLPLLTEPRFSRRPRRGRVRRSHHVAARLRLLRPARRARSRGNDR